MQCYEDRFMHEMPVKCEAISQTHCYEHRLWTVPQDASQYEANRPHTEQNQLNRRWGRSTEHQICDSM